MPSAQDPFYVVKAEIQDSIDKLQSTFHQWESKSGAAEQGHLTKEVLAGCESIEWQVDELDKAIAIASRDPSWYGIDEAEVESRRRWTSNTRSQVGTMKKAVESGKGSSTTSHASVNGMRRELMRLPNSHQTDSSNQYAARDNDDFILSESDRQTLLIKRQDEELDELSESVRRIGGVGLTIHDELTAQEKILDELGSEMDSTTNRLDFVQKKVAMVMKKASAKGQISSTVCCIECGHFSTVYEPFLDLSVPVPTKKPPPCKAQQVPRTKKAKLPPKKGGKTRVRVNRDTYPLPVQTQSNQLSSSESSCPDQSVISVAGEMGTCSADSTLLGSEEIKSVADKEDLSSPNLVTPGESQHMQVLDNGAIKTSDGFSWLDYVEAGTNECDFISQKEDAPEVQGTESKDECLNELHGQAICESSGLVCFLKEDENLSPKFSSANGWEDKVPLQVQGSEVLLLPYKEESSSAAEIIGGDGEASSSVLGGGQEEVEFDGFGDLFNEPEVVAGPAPRPSSCREVMEAGFIISNSESDPDEVDDTDSPVSVESCLAHFIKPELLSDENAWHCENCSKVLQHQKMEEKKQARAVSDRNETGIHDEPWHAVNSCSVKVRTIGNGDIKNDQNVQNLVACDKHKTNLENGQRDELSLIVNEKDSGSFEMEDTHNDELQSSSFHNTCNEESCSHLAVDSCVTENVQRRDSPMIGSDNNDSEEADSKSVKVKRDATKRVLIYKAPPVLTIHLKRFSQDARGRLSKLNGHVNFRETMDIRPYIDPRCINEEKYAYHLVGLVEHSGTMRGGHYVAYVRGGQRNCGKGDKENEGSTWYQASDAYVREVSLDEVLRCEAYILFYEKI